MRRHILMLGVLAGLPAALGAQSDSTGSGPAGTVAITFDQYYAGRGRLHGFSLRGSGPPHAGVTRTFGAGYARDSKSPTTGIFALDLGVGNLSTVSSAMVLVEFGATGVMGEGTALFGGYGGLTLLLPVGRGLALRIGGSRRAYLVEGFRGLWLLSVGLSSVACRIHSDPALR